MMGSLLLLGHHYHSASSSTLVPLLALMIYVVSFSLGWGPIPWLLMGELLPTRTRGLTASIVTG